MYHHDNNSEPTISVIGIASGVLQEHNDELGMIITIYLDDSYFAFCECRHFTNLSNEEVVFSSKHDDETFWIISFS
jgi:hypothetical protein